MRYVNNFEYAVFSGLLLLITLTAIPYGTVEVWWEALFICGVLTIFSLWAIYDSLKNQWRWQARAVTLPMLALALFAFIQSLRIFPADSGGYEAISADPEASWFFAFKILALALLLELQLRFTLSRPMLKNLVQLVIFIGVGSALFGILRSLFFSDLVESFIPALRAERGFGQFINRNHFALLMIVSSGLTLSHVLGLADRQKKVFYLGLSLVLIAGLALTTSRGGVIAFTVILLVLIFLHFKGDSGQDGARSEKDYSQSGVNKTYNWLKPAAFGLLLFIVATAGLIWVGDEKMLDRFEKGLQEEPAFEANDDRFPYRINFWKATLNMAQENPVAGVGFGGYKYGITKFYQGAGDLKLEQAHNDYFELLASGGILGALLTTWFAFAFSKKCSQRLKTRDKELRTVYYGALGGIAGIAVHSFADFGLHTLVNAVVLTTLIAVLAGDFDQDQRRLPPLQN